MSRYRDVIGRKGVREFKYRGHEAVIKFSVVASTERESWAVKLRDKSGGGRAGAKGEGGNFHEDVDGFSLKFVVVVVVAFLASERKRK